MTDTGITNIRGKEYHTVALRVSKFREAHPHYSLCAAVVERDSECVVMKAYIADETGRVLATGHAEEYRTSSQINRTSALENCETSAIGRALAAFGFGGTEFASANEVQNAIHQQNNPPANDAPKADPLKRNMAQAAKAATQWTYNTGPHKTKTAFEAAVKKLVHEIHGAGDLDMLECVLAIPEYKATIEQCKADRPDWYNGWEGMNPQFKPLGDLIASKRQELAMTDSIPDSIPDFIHEQAAVVGGAG